MMLKPSPEKIYLSFRNYFMTHPVKIYITTSVICFLVLALVQFILVYNTYDLLNRRFYYEKKGVIQEQYTRAIVNDQLFPGGKKIIDSYLKPRFKDLEILYKSDTAAFRRQTQILLNDIFHTLIKEQKADSLLAVIKQEGNITDSLEYLLRVQRIDLLFGDTREYVNIYNTRKVYPLIDHNIQGRGGLLIYGNLSRPDDQNLVIGLNVSDPQPYTYAINFTLNADPYNRRQMVFKQMRLMLTMSLLSMLAIITLFIITLRNWIKQKHLSDVKTDFINNITHEFHTPLSAIMVANKNIQNEKILDNKTALKSLSEIIERQSQRLKLLIGQVLDIAAIDKLSVHKEPTELNLLIRDIVTDFSIKFSAANLQLSLKEYPDEITVEVDSFHFATLLLNILDNAVKYNQQSVKEIDVAIVWDRENVQITVSDNGIGMTKETTRYIFDKFYRHQKDLTHYSKGLGLGLHYVKQCIDAHQWKLKVESEVGKGSTFVIIIPV
jgi:two-component system, OmpR family, phosphate regulon sensor histidine kinase PhoR